MNVSDMRKALKNIPGNIEIEVMDMQDYELSIKHVDLKNFANDPSLIVIVPMGSHIKMPYKRLWD